jgi:hypothetical protein
MELNHFEMIMGMGIIIIGMAWGIVVGWGLHKCWVTHCQLLYLILKAKGVLPHKIGETTLKGVSK